MRALSASLLLLALGAPGPAGATEGAGAAGASAAAPAPAPAATPATAPVSPLVAAARAARAAAGKPAPGRKVWTIEDLEELKKQRPGGMNVIAGGVTDPMLAGNGPTAAPRGVDDRYREIATKAEAEIARLERERLAGTNPLLRGLSGTQAERPTKEIDAELERWRQRRDYALKGLGEPSDAE